MTRVPTAAYKSTTHYITSVIAMYGVNWLPELIDCSVPASLQLLLLNFTLLYLAVQYRLAMPVPPPLLSCCCCY